MTSTDVINAGIANGHFDPSATYSSSIINNAGETVSAGGMTINMIRSQHEGNSNMWEEMHIDVITDELVFFVGGHANNTCNMYSLQITAELDPAIFGDLNYSSGTMSIQTQTEAQEMLERINDAIVAKDKIRAHLGALQNRLENTISNLQIQAENLQAAESRISDTDVAMEMTEFVRQQILTGAAVTMLAQANSMPQMALSVVQG